MNSHAQPQRQSHESGDRFAAKIQPRPFHDPLYDPSHCATADFSHVDLFSHAPQRGPIQAKLAKNEGRSEQFLPDREASSAVQPNSNVQKEIVSNSNYLIQSSLRTNLIQRSLEVTFQSSGNNITKLTAKGRPGWSAQVTKKNKPGEGESRGHIIEWSTRLRAFIEDAKQLGKADFLKKYGFQDGADTAIKDQIHKYLVEFYNDLKNIAINDTKKDNDAGGLANQLAQEIDQTTNQKIRLEKIKKLFPLSFNPGKNKAEGLKRLPQYLEEFSTAWGVPKEIVSQWAEDQKDWKSANPQETKAEEIVDTSQNIANENLTQLPTIEPMETEGETNHPNVVVPVRRGRPPRRRLTVRQMWERQYQQELPYSEFRRLHRIWWIETHSRHPRFRRRARFRYPTFRSYLRSIGL